MLDDIQLAFWFLLPAAVANAAPIFSAHIPFWKSWQTPIDGGATHHGTPIMGKNKTWRGLLSGMIAATIVLALQITAYEHYAWAHDMAGPVDYTSLPLFLLGPLLGLGALGGDAVESFFKRRHGIKSGQKWFPFDQLDYIIGAILVSLPFVQFSWGIYVWILLLWCLVHVAASYVGWLLGLKDEPI